MGYLCDFCGRQRSMVYCQSDTAFLCLSCDQNVHSANALSKRHSRTLVCERCNAEPASVRCIDEGISLCQNCHFVGHDRSVASSLHKTQHINSYSGCPSSAELSTIWSFISEIPFSSSKDSSCQEGLGSLSIADITTKNSADPAIKDIQCNAGVMLGGHDLQRVDTSCDWIGSSSVPELLSCEVRGRHGCTNSSKMYYNTGISRICDDDPYADLDMDEVDIDLENYDELFGYSLTHSEHLLENGGIGSLFIRQAKFTADSNCHGRPGVEGLSAGITNQMQATCSNAVSGDSAMSIKTEPSLGLATKQTHSGVSFSGITGDNSVDYQDCGASSMLLLGEPPWCPPCPENSLQSSTRTEAVMRYKEKKKSRKFDKRVRYASRKERADVRKRVKGRFIKAGELYDYDPTRSV